METIKDTKTLPMNGDLAKKFESSRNLKVSFDSSKAKIEFKDSEHKRGRMKVTLKFGAEEAEGFVNFCKLAKPDQMAQDDFVKFIFYKGVESLQLEFARRVEEFKQSNPEEFAKLKADLDSAIEQSEGSVTIVEDKP
jgi:hypothetical protein